MNRSKVCEMMESALTQAVGKLDRHIAQVTKKALLRFMEILENKNNLTFVRGTLRKDLCKMLTSMINDIELREVLKTAVLQVTSKAPMMQAIFMALVTNESIMASVSGLLLLRQKWRCTRLHSSWNSFSYRRPLFRSVDLPHSTKIGKKGRSEIVESVNRKNTCHFRAQMTGASGQGGYSTKFKRIAAPECLETADGI